MLGLKRAAMRRDNPKPVAAYSVQFSYHDATLILMQGDTRRHVLWLGSREAISMATDRQIATMWMMGVRIPPQDCRTREIPLELV